MNLDAHFFNCLSNGRVFTEKENFDELTMKLYLEIGHKRTTRKKALCAHTSTTVVVKEPGAF